MLDDDFLANLLVNSPLKPVVHSEVIKLQNGVYSRKLMPSETLMALEAL